MSQSDRYVRSTPEFHADMKAGDVAFIAGDDATAAQLYSRAHREAKRSNHREAARAAAAMVKLAADALFSVETSTGWGRR